MNTRSNICIWALLLVSMLRPSALHAMSFAHSTWEELVLKSDFVGVVECIQAGGIVARYRVIENWTGPEPETGVHINIRMAVSPNGPHFPSALVGERYLVIAFKDRNLSKEKNLTQAGFSPFMFRSLPSDFSLSFQGTIEDPENHNHTFFDSQAKDMETFRAEVQKLLGMDEPEREAALLRARAEIHLFGLRSRYGFRRGRESRLNASQKSLAELLENAQTADEVLNLLLNTPLKVDSVNWDHQRALANVLLEAGGKQTLKWIRDPKASITMLDGARLYGIMRKLDSNLNPDSNETDRCCGKEVIPDDPSQIYSEAFAAGPEQHNWSNAFAYFAIHDPQRVADWLRDRQSSGPDSWGNWEVYCYVSYYGWRCEKDRVAMLSDLADRASNDYVRVAAAVYLTFDDEEAGKKRLRELMKLDGDPGVWAALTLARRGDKSSMPRALKVLLTHGKRDRAFNHEGLLNRVWVLLSNSCSASGVPFPNIPADEYEAMDNPGDDPLVWWEANRDKITLYDPWLPMLIEQKVD